VGPLVELRMELLLMQLLVLLQSQQPTQLLSLLRWQPAHHVVQSFLWGQSR
jgi:hypothetical protein